MNAGEAGVREVDVLVVGGGPSGLAVACALGRAGVERVEVLDRELEAGGVPRHCHHTGFGIRDLRRVLTGPAYAAAWVQQARDSGAVVRPGVSVTGWPGPGLALTLTSPAGPETVAARAVVLATGARERPRAARLIPGDRGPGVLTTGQLQQLVYRERLPVGRRAVVVGAEHVSFSALLTLDHAGVEVVAMVTEHPAHQSFPAFAGAARLRYAVPVLRSARVSRIVGRRRVEAVEVTRCDGGILSIPCDTVVLTGDWIPDHELARLGGLVMDRGTRGPRVDTALSTSRDGVFAVGNLVHPAHTADVAAVRARAAVPAVLSVLRRGPGARQVGPPSGAGSAGVSDELVPVEVVAPLRWVSPQVVTPSSAGAPGGCFLIWPNDFAHGWVEVRQGVRLLGRWRRRLVANRPASIPDGWIGSVDPTGPPVTGSVVPW